MLKTGRYQGGFIITIELILITTILVIGSLAGLVSIRDALIKRMAHQQSQDITVYDATGRALGKAVGFDEHEAPLLPYVDRTVPPLAPDPLHRNYRALLGVRDDRFTSREPVYYDGANCTGTACIKAPSDEAADNTGLSGLNNTGAVGYLYGLQGGPTYAVGRSPDGIKGYLYRSTAAACPIAPENIRSRYLSQKVVTGSPCEARSATTTTTTTGGGTTTTTTTPADTSCLVDAGLGLCSCPDGYVDQGDVLALYTTEIDAAYNDAITGLPNAMTVPVVTVGTVCCPSPGTLIDDGNIPNAVVYNLLTAALADQTKFTSQVERALAPYSGELLCGVPVTEPPGEVTTETDWGNLVTVAAEEVMDPNDPLSNALDGFVAPFQVNLPANMSEDSWISTPPDGVEGVLP